MSDGMSDSTPVGTVVYIGIASISYSLVPGGRAADLMLSKNMQKNSSKEKYRDQTNNTRWCYLTTKTVQNSFFGDGDALKLFTRPLWKQSAAFPLAHRYLILVDLSVSVAIANINAKFGPVISYFLISSKM